MGRPGRIVRRPLSVGGTVGMIWERPVPYVPDTLLRSSIFLYGSEEDATEGANWGGSGVLMGVPFQANPSLVHLYAVSNAHVIHECPVIRIAKEKLAKGNGQPAIFPKKASDWISHPDGDDIAICSLGALPDREYWYMITEFLILETDIGPEAVGPGDECMIVGRYINHKFRQFDRPIIRFGNLAMLPELIYQEKRAFKQESFLVDMRSQSGFSGSPVYIYFEEPGWRDGAPTDGVIKDTLSGMMGKTWMLGIDWGHLPIWGDVLDAQNQKIGRMEVNGGMTGVVPAWKLAKLLDEPEIKADREQAEREQSEREVEAAVLDTAEPDNEFDRFEDLTRKVLQVPKSEIDEKRKK